MDRNDIIKILSKMKLFDCGIDPTTDTIVITQDLKVDDNIVIPPQINGKAVTRIGKHAFDGSEQLISIVIPDSVTEIGSCAFLECTKLTEVSIPNSVTTIGDNAFNECTSLKSLTIPDSVTSIGDDAFSNCYCAITYKGKTYDPREYKDLYAAINGK